MVVPMVTVPASLTLFIAPATGTRAIAGASLVMVTMVWTLRILVTAALESLAKALLLVTFSLRSVARLFNLAIASAEWATVACLVFPVNREISVDDRPTWSMSSLT